MLLETNDLLFIALIFFVIALLYSSIGFGGGSSYLAVLSLFLLSFFSIRSIALLCNLVVVLGSCYMYFKKGHLQFRKFLPFIVSSIPMAYAGAIFRLKEEVFFGILGCALILSAVSLGVQTVNKRKPQKTNEFSEKRYPWYVAYVLGGLIGLLSGLVGIGGGIFLAPLLYHLKWDRSLKIAALASFFILVNSVSGIIGLASNATLEIPGPEVLVLLFAVFLGGQLGIRLSLKKLSSSGIKLLTALLVLLAGIRVILVNAFHLSF